MALKHSILYYNLDQAISRIKLGQDNNELVQKIYSKDNEVRNLKIDKEKNILCLLDFGYNDYTYMVLEHQETRLISFYGIFIDLY